VAAALFVTGATGLVGRGTLPLLLRARQSLRATVLVRDEARWRGLAASLGPLASRVRPAFGDLTQEGLGLDTVTRSRCARDVVEVIHLAADTTFSRPLADARAVNTDGTARVLAVSSDWPGVRRILFVSTAFVAGRQTGRVFEHRDSEPVGWVNAYEQSKWEAERLVRADGRPWVVMRPSTVVCDDASGRVSQYNAVHRALRLYYHGLVPMMPGTSDSAVDVITTEYVCRALASLALREDAVGRTYHLCAGDAALPLERLLDLTYEVWRRDPRWRRRSVARPIVTDPATYELFEASLDEVADRRLKQVLRSLSHFVPQLALPKRFDTTLADAAAGEPAPLPERYWRRMVEQLARGEWAANRPAAA
jgi:long-chain acyl-CoA synthetase